MREVLKIIKRYCEENRKCNFTDIMNESNLSSDEIEDILQKLKRGGDIFEPTSGFYKVMI